MSSENRGNPQRLKELYSEYVISQIVLTRYNQRNYRCDDVAWDLTPKSTFELSTGETVRELFLIQIGFNCIVQIV